jgi:hypothetical protein
MMVLLLMANYASYRPKIHLSQLFRFLEPLLTNSRSIAEPRGWCENEVIQTILSMERLEGYFG